ncbi:MAG: tripartite tricarboxylate transporter substrate binding protein [Pseudomonadota bacterium]
MRDHFVRTLTGAALAALFSAFASASGNGNQAGTYPTKPVRMIIPLAPGGGSDIVGRMLAQALTDHWNQTVVVDNRPGAGSTVGTAIAAKAQPDGYTTLVSSSSIAISPALYKNLSFDIKRDFRVVTLIASQPSLLAVHSSVPAKNLKEFIALAKSRPGKLEFGSAGPGSATHLGTELLKFTAGVDLLHVPYKSAGLATVALLAGETQVLLTNMASLLPHIKTGRIRALGITSTKRSPLAAEIPTIAESGLDKFEYATWYGMLVPVGTPKTVITKVQGDAAKVLNTPQVQQRFVGQGLEVYANTPAEFEAYLNNEIARWAKVVQAAGVRMD